MSVNNAKFLIQRAGSQYFCQGSDLYEKVQDTDLFAIYRGGALYSGDKDKIRDSDYLVCVEGGETKKVLGSLVRPLINPPELGYEAFQFPISVTVGTNVYSIKGRTTTPASNGQWGQNEEDRDYVNTPWAPRGDSAYLASVVPEFAFLADPSSWSGTPPANASYVLPGPEPSTPQGLLYYQGYEDLYYTRGTSDANQKVLFYVGDLVASPLEGSGSATLVGTFRVGNTLSVSTIPTFTGGASPVVYEAQYQKSTDGSDPWTGFNGPWQQYNPDQISGVPTILLPAVTENQYIRLQARATDNNGVQVIQTGQVYGPIAASAGPLASDVQPQWVDSNPISPGDTVPFITGTFTGGAPPIVPQYKWKEREGNTWVSIGDWQDQPNSEVQRTITLTNNPNVVECHIETRCIDDNGFVVYNNGQRRAVV